MFGFIGEIMDMGPYGVVVGIVLAIVLFPFWLTWKLIGLLIGVGKEKLEQVAEDARVRELNVGAHERTLEAQAEIERRQQKVADALPKNPPTGMRATFVFDTTPVSSMGHVVTVVVELPEEDRAILRAHELGGVELKNVPAYTPDQIKDIKTSQQQSVDSTADPMMKEWAQQAANEFVEKQTKRRKILIVVDLLREPYSAYFETLPQAEQFAEGMRKDILPKLRELIEKYRCHKDSETIEF